MTIVQQAIRNFLNIGTLGQFAYMRKIGFEPTLGEYGGTHYCMLRFFKWVKETDRTESFLADFINTDIID